ncbi:MAG TPA: hypothetical protein VGO47_09665 [Chlamydiales bacterium]|nr:hypothetical protein [Chlamydiales bacterium]
MEEAFKTLALVARLGLGTFLSVGSAGAAQSGSEEEGKGMVNEEVKTRPSYGRLDMAFKFGGKPQQQAVGEEKKVRSIIVSLGC